VGYHGGAGSIALGGAFQRPTVWALQLQRAAERLFLCLREGTQMRKVAIVMGSKSDLPVAEKAVGVLRDYGVQMEVRVLSAHRCPNEAREFAASAREGGFSVILAFAGMADTSQITLF